VVKKKWEQPKLIVLIKPDLNDGTVLTCQCKSSVRYTKGGADNNFDHCGAGEKGAGCLTGCLHEISS
jgi:hypothetical protein